MKVSTLASLCDKPTGESVQDQLTGPSWPLALPSLASLVLNRPANAQRQPSLTSE